MTMNGNTRRGAIASSSTPPMSVTPSSSSSATRGAKHGKGRLSKKQQSGESSIAPGESGRQRALMVDRFARRDQAASTEGVEEHKPTRLDLHQACSKTCFKSLKHSVLNLQTERRGDTEDANPVCDRCYQLLVNAWKHKIRSLDQRFRSLASICGTDFVKTVQAKDKLEVYTDLRALELYDLKPGRDNSLASSSRVSLRGGGSSSVGRGRSSSVGRGRSPSPGNYRSPSPRSYRSPSVGRGRSSSVRSSSVGRGRSLSFGRGPSSSVRSSSVGRGRSSSPRSYRSSSVGSYRSPSPGGYRTPSPSRLEGFCGDCGEFHDDISGSKLSDAFISELSDSQKRMFRLNALRCKLYKHKTNRCHAKEGTVFAEALKKSGARRLLAKEARAKLVEELIPTRQHSTMSTGSGKSETMGPFARYLTRQYPTTSAGSGKSKIISNGFLPGDPDDHVVFGCNLGSDFNACATSSDSDGHDSKDKSSESTGKDKAKATPNEPAKPGKSTHCRGPFSSGRGPPPFV